jgi:hypothetical protein
MMNSPHLRPSRIYQGLYDNKVPSGQARALHRRHALEAQQRAFREGEAGRPAMSPADLTPIWRRTPGESSAR